MTQWVQAGGYAEDLQAAYDYFKSGGGPAAAENFFRRYQRCVEMVTNRPKNCGVRGHGWRQQPIPNSTYSIFYGQRGGLWMLVGIQSAVQDPDRIQALLLVREVATGQE